MSLKAFVGVPPAQPNTSQRRKVILDICLALRCLHENQPLIVQGGLILE